MKKNSFTFWNLPKKQYKQQKYNKYTLWEMLSVRGINYRFGRVSYSTLKNKCIELGLIK